MHNSTSAVEQIPSVVGSAYVADDEISFFPAVLHRQLRITFTFTPGLTLLAGDLVKVRRHTRFMHRHARAAQPCTIEKRGGTGRGRKMAGGVQAVFFFAQGRDHRSDDSRTRVWADLISCDVCVCCVDRPGRVHERQ